MASRSRELLLLAVVALTAGCTAGPITRPDSPNTVVSIASTPSSSAAPHPDQPVPESDAVAISALIASINGTATEPVTAQQQLLQSVVDPAFAAGQAACAAASITLVIDPVMSNLQPDSDPAPSSADPASTTSTGVRYRVPVLLEIYRDGFRTGTDMTMLHLSVIAGVAHTMPLCLV